MTTDRPRVLVLEGLSGASHAVRVAGGEALELDDHDVKGMETAFTEGAVDALLLTGGGDVDPRRYGRRVHPETYGVDEIRDYVELRAVRLARRYRLPILGICRGSQVLNVALGGTLVQHLGDRLGDKRARANHHNFFGRVRLRPGSKVREAVGLPAVQAVHLHHQAVQRCGRGLRPVAWHPDGTVEAVESTNDVWQVGVQFHPEMAMKGDPERGLFRALVLAAAETADLAAPSERLDLARATWRQPAASTSWEWDDEEDAYARSETVRVYYQRAVASPVKTSWRCFRCQPFVTFDVREDFRDHMQVLHGLAWSTGDGDFRTVRKLPQAPATSKALALRAPGEEGD